MPEADPDDALLERALRATPAVLAVAGLPERTAMSLRAPPFLIDGAPDAQGELPRVERFTGALTNVEQLNRVRLGPHLRRPYGRGPAPCPSSRR